MSAAFDKVVHLFRALARKSWTYPEIEEKFGVSHRTALRWIASVREQFGEALAQEMRADGRKAFHLKIHDAWFQRLSEPNSNELGSLDIALKLLKQHSMMAEHGHLESLRGTLRNRLEERNLLLRLDTDAEALYDAVGLAFRPGPRTVVSKEVRALLRRALLALKKVEFIYQRPNRAPSKRVVGPYGLLFGGAERLVGVLDGKEQPLQFRLDRMSRVRVLDEAFTPPPDAFSEYCRKLFGSFGEPPFDVEWQFHRQAPEADRWTFHPDQEREIRADGSVVVRFRAGGAEAMARHLFGWWDWIEGIRPKKLRKRVLQMRLAGLAPLVEEFADQESADRIRELAEVHQATMLRPDSDKSS